MTDIKKAIRSFGTGATRNIEGDKLDYEGFLSPVVLRRYAEYMHLHRRQADGTLRDSDNWQRGMPRRQYLKSLMRHVMALWLGHRGHDSDEDMETALAAIIFNSQGLLHEILIDRDVEDDG